MSCSADDELAAEGFVRLDAEAKDQAFARIVSSSPPPRLHPNALRGIAACCPLKGPRRPRRSPSKRVLPRVVLCR